MMRSTSSSWMMTGPMSPMRRQRRKTNLKSRQQTRSGLRSGVGVGASKLEELMSRQLEEAGIEFEREQMLIPGRKFRFDFVLPQSCLIVECEGGTWSGGRHTSGDRLSQRLREVQPGCRAWLCRVEIHQRPHQERIGH